MKKIKDLSELENPSIETIVLINKRTKEKSEFSEREILSQFLVDALIDWRDNDWFIKD